MPDWEFPADGIYLLGWWRHCATGITRVINNSVIRLSWRDLLAWRDLTGNIVETHEWDAILAMDGAYCSAYEVELADSRARAEQEAKDQHGG